jgi:hypothetical protein
MQGVWREGVEQGFEPRGLDDEVIPGRFPRDERPKGAPSLALRFS